MAEATLINCNARIVSRDDLDKIDAPPPTSTWFPIAHRDVLKSTCETLEGAGFQLKGSRLSLTRGDQRFFGVLDLTTPVTAGVSLAVGIRNSTDQSFPIGFACGTRVMVCDNLSFTAEVVVNKKHTKHGRIRFEQGIATAVSGLHQYKEAAADWINRMGHYDLSEDAANSYILRSFEEGIVSSRLLPLIINEWRNPKFEEYKPRTGWALFNCFTDVLGRTKQATQPAEAARTTMKLSRLFSPPEVLDVECKPEPAHP
ncbi:MAG TPA: hypothetical protein VMV69_10405 [Pirellulales bacterium]|nr:hypothetical protein [Pirellulales bacterium]